MSDTMLEKFSKEELIRLLNDYAKNQLALDGVWFQSIERKYGMDEAIFHDEEAWKIYTAIEARRIKTFLGLPDNPGLEGLKAALELRFNSRLNKDSAEIIGNRLIYKNLECRVQTARKRKGIGFHPCKSVGEFEYGGFAKVIDNRISCRCVSCYPDITDPNASCVWEFTLNENTAEETT